MAIYNSLSWQNENALSSYPFDKDLEPQDFIVDASFIQFDNFVPVLNYCYVADEQIDLSFTFDFGTLETVSFLRDQYDSGAFYRHLRIHQPLNNRYLGTVVFGIGANTLWEQSKGQRLVFNQKFSSTTVKSIPYKDAVYLFDSIYGNVSLGRTSEDRAIFYNASEELNAITFNAVGGHSVTEDIENGASEGLKQINLVKPLHNNINLASNDIIKITPTNAVSLEISLVSGNRAAAFALPTLIA
jgi:hypothetical protein